MKKFVSSLRQSFYKLIDIQISIVLAIFYYLFLIPFVLLTKFKNYLGLKSSPHWQERKFIEDINEFLKQQ